MNFLVLCLVALICWLTPWRAGLPLDPAGWWVEQGSRTAGKTNPGALWSIGLVIAVPLLALVGVLWLVEGIAYGSLTLLTHALVLLACVSRTDPLGAMTASIERAWRRGDHQTAALIAERDWSIRADAENDLAVAVRARIMIEALRGYFVPAFWYALLGPVAALGYRLAWACAQRKGQAGAAMIEATQALEWIPLRLLGCSLALVGRFRQTMEVLRRRIADWDTPASQLGAELIEAAQPTTAATGLRLAITRRLLLYCMLVWSVTIAFLSLIR